jgi:hypothetical protein
MAIDLVNEHPLTAKQAAQYLGRPKSTILRWMRKGLCGVVLESFDSGVNQLSTSREALQRFADGVRAAKLATHGGSEDRRAVPAKGSAH